MFSFIIGYHSERTNNLLQTLRFLQLWHAPIVQGSELILLCQDKAKGDHSQIAKFGKCHQQDLNLDCMRLSKVTNTGVDLASYDKLVILESDRILPQGYFETIFEELREGVQITTRKMLKLTQDVDDEDIIRGVFKHKEESRSESNEIGFRNMWSGNTALMKQDYYKAGKMDEEYTGYGWADNDMSAAMASITKSIFRPEIEYHLYHPPMTYGSGDQKQMFIDNGLRYCRKWNKTIPAWFQKEITLHKYPHLANHRFI